MQMLQTILYHEYEALAPQEGKHILAQQTDNELIVYQAYQPAIAAYAVQYQRFGGAHYSYGRMSWIKPNFLWMMYRCGWASKPGQERVLAIRFPKVHFETILRQAVYSSFQTDRYTDHAQWQAAGQASDVRLQWDPDHDPYGEKLARRAIQLGLRGDTLAAFGQEWITQIEDVTDFVHEQATHVRSQRLDQLQVPIESPYAIEDIELSSFILG